jgi:hypothetical protein
MNPNARLVEESVEFKTQAAADRSFDTSFEEEKVVVNPTPSSVISKDVEAIQALEITDIMQTSVEDNSNESNISRTRVFPDVPFDRRQARKLTQKRWTNPFSVLTNPILGMFPMYCLTVSQVRRVKSKKYGLLTTILKKTIIHTWK